MILVLYALQDLGGINTRQQVINHISNSRWYEVVGDDLSPTRTSREARYRIDLAWARKDCVLADCINNFEKNAWELNRKGRDLLSEVTTRFRSGMWNLGDCQYLKLSFKRLLSPDFVPKPEDRKRLSSSDLKALIDSL